MILEFGIHESLEVCVNDLGSPYGVTCHDCGSFFFLSQIPGVGEGDLRIYADDASFFEDKLGIPKDSPYR